MKLLHIIASLNPASGGPPEGLRSICFAYKKHGHEVDILTIDPPRSPWLQNYPHTVHAVGPGHLKYLYTPKLTGWLRKNHDRYDAVIINGIWQFHSLAAWHILRRTDTPYFVFTHGMLDPWFKRRYPLKHLKKLLYWPWADYRVLRDARGVFFTSDEERMLARQSFSLYQCNEIIVPYGILAPPSEDPEQQVEAFRNAYPETCGKRILLFISRIHPKKGCDILIEAFARIACKDNSLHLVIAGPDQIQWRSQLERRTHELGVTSRITWTGMLSGTLKWGALRASEAFVLPSHSENFGIVVAEALACGTPVLISNKVNIWREIERTGCGLVANDDMESTTSMLQHWLRLPEEKKQQMAVNALEAFKDNFEIVKTVDNLLDKIATFSK